MNPKVSTLQYKRDVSQVSLLFKADNVWFSRYQLYTSHALLNLSDQERIKFGHVKVIVQGKLIEELRILRTHRHSSLRAEYVSKNLDAN